MPKVMKKVVKKVLPKKTGLQVGSKVYVLTEYTVKRDKTPNQPNLIAVEDKYGDRVLHFRREELKLKEE